MVRVAAEITDLRLKYPGEDNLLFKGLSFKVRPGEKVLLLGPSGCGKSTLLQVLSGLVPNTIELPMKAASAVIPEKCGYVFQDPDAQFCMPYADEELAFVMENLSIPRSEMTARIKQELHKVGLKLNDPHTLIGSMSQGMKQRLAIASVLTLDPEVIFLDEPTALLDPEGTEYVWNSIKQAASDRTLVIVEHKIDHIIDWVDRIVVFTPNGDILADGPPQEVFRSYRTQLHSYGIWYPGVWDDYWSQHHSDVDLKTSQGHGIAEPLDISSPPLVWMKQFLGLRGGTAKISVDHAEIQNGEWIAVMGPNGAGKSSLLLAMMRLIKTEGICKIDGLETKKVEELAKRVAFVFQNPEFQFVTNTVMEEVAFSLMWEPLSEEQRKQQALEILTKYGLEAYQNRHPYQLSMGQKRRLSVAVAIAREQRLLLLDEPTFGLDARSTFAMLEHLEQLQKQGVSMIMVTHDQQIAMRFATRIWHVQNGIITEDKVKEVMTSCS